MVRLRLELGLSNSQLLLQWVSGEMSLSPSLMIVFVLTSAFLRPAYPEAVTAWSNLLVRRCYIWCLLIPWQNVTQSHIQHSSLTPFIPCSSFLPSHHHHHHPFLSPSDGCSHCPITISRLHFSHPQQQLDSSCIWPALLFCLSLPGWWVTEPSGQLL